MNTPHSEPLPVNLRAAGAAVTGGSVALAVCSLFAATDRRHEQSCAAVDGLCRTWWDWAAIPVAFAAALTVLAAVYKVLDISPRIAVITPTVVFAPVLLGVARSTGGMWAATVAGGVWSGCLALATVGDRRHRMAGLPVAAALVLATLILLIALPG
ncbi:hypothetical protein AB0C52_21095 [Streptomyces sp. NPDC048717]|uniref:hypothetical protein n=1 Tax=Streptomyces sp. NPDC048717 TaxID=3154928 RepID=UPI00342B125C